MKILYFAWLRQRIGTDTEEFVLTNEIETVEDLINWLITRGSGYADAFAKPEIIRAAVNLEYVSFDHRLNDEDEVAFFPPVTGG